MNKALRLLCAASTGAALMYFFDPSRGKRRRALLRDKAKHTVRMVNDAAGRTSRDFRNHVHGTFCKVQSLFRERPLTDEVLQERVRSKLGRVISHPKSVRVTAKDGVVNLSGSIPAWEEHSLLEALTGMEGVKNIENFLEVHAPAGDVQVLQG